MPWTCYYLNYLVVSTHQKKISQIRPFPQVGLKTKNTWNHTPQWRLLNPLLHVACPLLRSATWKGVCAQLLQKCFSVTGESTVSFFFAIFSISALTKKMAEVWCPGWSSPGRIGRPRWLTELANTWEFKRKKGHQSDLTKYEETNETYLKRKTKPDGIFDVCAECLYQFANPPLWSLTVDSCMYHASTQICHSTTLKCPPFGFLKDHQNPHPHMSRTPHLFSQEEYQWPTGITSLGRLGSRPSASG